MREQILTFLAGRYEHAAYGDSIRKHLIETGTVPNGSWLDCPSTDEMVRMKRDGLIWEHAEWGVSSYGLLPKGREAAGIKR